MSHTETVSDKELLNMINIGGKHRNDALAEMMGWESVKNAVKRYILNNSGQKVDVENMLIEAIIHVDQKVRKGSFQLTGSLKGYLVQTAKYQWMNELRRKKELPLDEQVHDTAVYDAPVENEIPIQAQKLKRAWSKISERCKEILKYWQLNYPMDEIAVMMNISSAAMARKNKYQCLKGLKKIINDPNIS